MGAALEKVTKISDIMLDDNQIGNSGGIALLKLSKKNKYIANLRIQNNNITDDGIYKIAASLQKNSSLKRLYLSFNTLGSKAYETMVKTLMINRTLEYVGFADYRLDRTDLCSLRLLNDCNLLSI